MDQEHENTNSEPEHQQRQRATVWLVGLFALLFFWIVSITTWTTLFGPESDWRKAALLAFPMLVFLAVWALLLHSRRKAGEKS